MRIDAIRAIAIRCQRRIAEVLERFANREPNPSARVDAASDFYTAMLRFAAVVTVAPGNIRSCDQCQEVIERHALQATKRLNRDIAHCPVCGQPMPPGGAAVANPTPQGWVRCAPTDAGARHDDCIAKPNPQIQNQQQGSSSPDLNREQVLAWIREHGLAGADLQRVDLSGAYLRSADLTRADLGDARLPYANLSDADLTGADFAGAIFDNAQLQYADLSRAQLDDGTLSDEEMAYFLAALHHTADAATEPPPAGATQ